MCAREKGSEFEPRLARGFCKCLHAAVIEVSVAVEHDLVDLLLETNLGDERADLLGGVRLRVFAQRGLEVARERGRSGERAPVRVDHDLSVDVGCRAIHAEPRALGAAADLLPNAEAAAFSASELSCHAYF